MYDGHTVPNVDPVKLNQSMILARPSLLSSSLRKKLGTDNSPPRILPELTTGAKAICFETKQQCIHYRQFSGVSK